MKKWTARLEAVLKREEALMREQLFVAVKLQVKTGSCSTTTELCVVKSGKKKKKVSLNKNDTCLTVDDFPINTQKVFFSFLISSSKVSADTWLHFQARVTEPKVIAHFLMWAFNSKSQCVKSFLDSGVSSIHVLSLDRWTWNCIHDEYQVCTQFLASTFRKKHMSKHIPATVFL